MQGPMREGFFARKFAQSSILKTIDLLEQRLVHFQPFISHIDVPKWSPGAALTHARTVEERNGAHNAGEIWHAAAKMRCVDQAGAHY